MKWQEWSKFALKNNSIWKIIPVLIGFFALFENSNTFAQTKQISCQIRAYVIDQDSHGLNIRSIPNSGQILGVLPANTDVQVFASQGNWMLVSPIDPKSQGIKFQGKGWVYVPLLGLSTRGYDKNTVSVFASANYKSKVVGQIPSSRPVKLLSCQGQWAFVEKDGIKGWLPREDQCAAALTTCP